MSYGTPKKILLSRTDNLGDVVLTLPTAGLLKRHFPDAEIYFLGKTYTRPIIEACSHIIGFLDRNKILTSERPIEALKKFDFDVVIHIFPDRAIAKTCARAGIPVRIGTSHRIFHWLYCNKRVPLGRKKSDLHEAQLNAKLLKPLGITETPALNEIPALYGLNTIPILTNNYLQKINNQLINIILHPKSKGSAREWPLESWLELARSFSASKFKLVITGTEEEGKVIRSEKPELFNYAEDMTGKFSLGELISFINSAHGLVACSTGPLHIAAALGKFTLGIYPPIRPIHPGRWAPLGNKARFIVYNKTCKKCRQPSSGCDCMSKITADQVRAEILSYFDTIT